MRQALRSSLHKSKNNTARVVHKAPAIIDTAVAATQKETVIQNTAELGTSGQDTVGQNAVAIAAAVDTSAANAIDSNAVIISSSNNTAVTDSSIIISDTLVTAINADSKEMRGDTTVLSSSFDYTTKIRVITINKITKDTIIEWLTPEQANDISAITSAALAKQNSGVKVPRIAVSEDELYNHHTAVYYTQKPGDRVYELCGDTLFVQAPELSLAQLYKALAASNAEVAAPPKPEPVAKNKKPIKQISPRRQRVDSLRAEQRSVRDSIMLENIALEKEMRKRTIDSVAAAEPLFVPSNDTLIGDAWLDNDPEAYAISNNNLLQVLNGNIKDNWRSFKAKAKVHYSTDKDEQNVSINLRLVNDSVTWASVIVLLEAARVLVTTDSTTILNKLKDEYAVYGNANLQTLTQLPIDAADLQDLIIGKIPLKGLRQVRAKSNNNIVGIYANSVGDGPKATLIYNNDSTLRSIYIRGYNKQGYYTLRCEYNQYEIYDVGKISMSRKITSFINGVTTQISMELAKVEFDTSCETPFEIPAKFKRQDNISLKQKK
jgi:hypothetical protein